MREDVKSKLSSEMQRWYERVLFMVPKLYAHADPKDVTVAIEDGKVVVYAPPKDSGVVTMNENEITWAFPRVECARSFDCGDRITVNGVEYRVTMVDRGIDGQHSSIAITMKKSGVTPTLTVVK